MNGSVKRNEMMFCQKKKFRKRKMKCEKEKLIKKNL